MYAQSCLVIGVGGPVGAGKTTLIKCLCTELRDDFSIGVIANDIRSTSDADHLINSAILDSDRIRSVVTGVTKKGVFRYHPGPNQEQVKLFRKSVHNLDLILIEGVADRQDARFSSDFVDDFIYVIDATAGTRIPLKGGPGITQSGLLVVNKVDLVEQQRQELGTLALNIQAMRQLRPYLFCALTTGLSVDQIVSYVAAKCKSHLRA